ncbi:MAG: hypothetical protein K2X99_01380 [Gemmatimonadaceae bacterium]|nr:hypothetical protein [Gemmatimonadaceae bacterium]
MLASMVRSLRTEPDTAILFSALLPTWKLIDEALLVAAVDVLSDATVTVNSRIAMTLTVASQISNGMFVVYWDRITSGEMNCGIGLTGTPADRVGAQPSEAVVRSAASRLRAVVDSPLTPPPVRNAADCTLGELEARLKIPD